MSKRFRVSYSPEAYEDLTSIYSYIALRLKAKDTAKKQTDRIRKEIRSLGEMPERYAPVDWEPWHSMGMRKLPIDNYVAYYLVDQDAQRVEIVRIFYGGRDAEGEASNRSRN